MNPSKSEIIKVSAFWQDELTQIWELNHEIDLDLQKTIGDFDISHQKSWKVEK
jgi:hypothetical protein